MGKGGRRRRVKRDREERKEVRGRERREEDDRRERGERRDDRWALPPCAFHISKPPPRGIHVTQTT